jgi:hypothetical protein
VGDDGLCYYSFMHGRTSVGSVVVVTVSALLLQGCGGAQDGPARSAAMGFLAAAQGDDGAAACALLAPAAREELASTAGAPCPEAVLDEDLATQDTRQAEVTVFDSMAQATVGSQTVFLSRYDGRWLVVAAACTPVPDAPYDCSIGLP